MHRFSGHWKGYYRQWGSNHDMQCLLIVDHDGNMAGRGSDISLYTVAGKIEPDGTFSFFKQFQGPTSFHQVIYSGAVEWRDHPVLRGEWEIPSDGQVDRFLLTPSNIGLEAAIISLSCRSAQEVLCMDHQQKRREIIDALSEIDLDVSSSELASLSDQELVKVAQDLTV